MPSFLIHSISFAAPLFGEEAMTEVEAKTAAEALEKFAKTFNNPEGLYSALCYTSAAAKAAGIRPIARWVCNHEIAVSEQTRGQQEYAYYGYGPGDFSVNGKRYKVPDPKAGRVFDESSLDAVARLSLWELARSAIRRVVQSPSRRFA